MNSAKANILKRLRTTGGRPVTPVSNTWQPPQYSEEEKLIHFKNSLVLSHAEVIDATEENWVQKLSDIAISKDLQRWLYSSDTVSGLAFEQHLSRPNPQTSEPRLQLALAEKFELIPYNKPIEEFKETLFHNINAAFTEVHAGIAETGTLVILPSKAEPRLMSLVPPVHVALFRKSTLLNNFSELLEQENWQTKGLPSNVLLISGPSKTADIQQTLAYGAHGPKELIVLII